MSDKPKDYGVEVLVTPELKTAIAIVRGESRQMASRETLEASVAAFRDAFNTMEGAEQMLEQAISMAGKHMKVDYKDIAWLGQAATFHEDLKATNDHIREQKLFGENNSLKGKGNEQRD